MLHTSSPYSHYLKKIIEIEKPDAVLPTLGGQTALNLSIELEKSGVLKENNVTLLGASPMLLRLQKIDGNLKSYGWRWY